MRGNRFFCCVATILADGSDPQDCKQYASEPGGFCYYHQKVVDGLIAPVDMPYDDQQVDAYMHKSTGDVLWIREGAVLDSALAS